MSDKKVFRWEGKDIEVSWDGRLCIHVQECTRAKGDLFESGRDPWCKPDEAEADHVAEVVERCPTGALAYKRKDDGSKEAAPGENTVVVANNGPLYIGGDLQVDGAADDMPGTKFRVALCRCGQSENKPFCDNTHEKVDFRDHGAVGETGDGFEEEGGVLEIKRAPDGPLLANGNFTVVSGGGMRTWQGTKAALCRCGASKNKPFCDGSHKGAGFKAE